MIEVSQRHLGKRWWLICPCLPTTQCKCGVLLLGIRSVMCAGAEANQVHCCDPYGSGNNLYFWSVPSSVFLLLWDVVHRCQTSFVPKMGLISFFSVRVSRTKTVCPKFPKNWDTRLHMISFQLISKTSACSAWAMYLLNALYKPMPGCFSQ